VTDVKENATKNNIPEPEVVSLVSRYFVYTLNFLIEELIIFAKQAFLYQIFCVQNQTKTISGKKWLVLQT
jgi:hypothetical protein